MTSAEGKREFHNLYLQPYHLLGQTQPVCHSTQTLAFGLQRCENRVNTSRYEGEAWAGEKMDISEQLDFLHR